MIRVMIVEDEPPTLRRIAGMIEKIDSEFFVAATALNGRAALEKMDEMRIDLVITDIRMPVMNGLELMDKIRESDPDVMIVVLSGHQDFEYAHHAMRAQSIDYLLKPMSEQAMRELLARIKSQHRQLNRERLKKSIAIQLNKSEAGAPQREAQDTVEVCLFCAGGFPFDDDAEMSPAADFWMTRSLENLAEEAGVTGFRWEFMGSTPVERILIFQDESKADGVCAMKRLHESLLGAMPVSCACFGERIELSRAGGALKRLRRALQENIRIGRSDFITVDDFGPAQEPAEDDEAARKLASWLASERGGQESYILSELFVRMEREGWPQRRILDLFLGASGLMERSGKDDAREAARHYQTVLTDVVCTALSMEEVKDAVFSLALPSPPNTAEGKQADVVQAIEKYLRGHYGEHITNQTLAAEFGYVPSYISVLFRQKYRLSPSEYLTQIRMDEAKKLIRDHPDMLIREVSERVGFKSQHHFSRIFKKSEGVRPTSYQL